MASTEPPEWGEWWPEAWAQRELDDASSEAPSSLPSGVWSAPRLPSARPRPGKPFTHEDVAEASSVADEHP